MAAPGTPGAFTFANERDAPPVKDQSRVEVLSWRAVETPTGELYLMMFQEAGVVRNTSAVVSVDASRRLLTTSSGREYVLHGPPEEEAIAKQVLQANAVRIGLASARDVSDRLWHQLQESLVGPSAFDGLLNPSAP